MGNGASHVYADKKSASDSSEAGTEGTFTAGVKRAEAGATRPWFWGFERSELPNPGSFDDLALELQNILKPQVFDGLIFTSNVGMNKAFSLGHVVNMGSKGSGWSFLANYHTPKLTMVSRLGGDGNLVGKIIANHTPRLISRVNAESTSDGKTAVHYDLEYRGHDFTSNVKMANSGLCTVSYLQSVTPFLALGSEFIYIKSSHMSGMTFSARLYNEKNSACINVVPTTGMMDMSYIYRPASRIQLATEFQCSLQAMESNVAVGYNYALLDGISNVTGKIDSSGHVSAVLNQQVFGGLGLMLSGELDHQRQDYKFGLGVSIES